MHRLPHLLLQGEFRPQGQRYLWMVLSPSCGHAAHHPQHHQVLLLLAEAVHPFRLPECEGEGRAQALHTHHERPHRNIFYLRKGNYFTINIKVKTFSDF